MDNKINKQKFIEYVSGFNLKDDRIVMKREHSIKTADVAKKIAKQLFYGDEELIELCYAIGLLHDIGRFYQWQTYQTFNDLESVDHGDYGSKILFESVDDNNLIKSFAIEEKWYGYLFLAIKFHNKLKIDESFVKNYCTDMSMDESLAISLCKLARDADKVDISRVVTEGKSKFSVPKRVDLSLTGYSSEIMSAIKNKHSCDFQFRRTALDYALSSFAYIYDFYYDISKKLFLKYMDKFIQILLDAYKNILNSEDYSTLQWVCEEAKKNFAK